MKQHVTGFREAIAAQYDQLRFAHGFMVQIEGFARVITVRFTGKSVESRGARITLQEVQCCSGNSELAFPAAE